MAEPAQVHVSVLDFQVLGVFGSCAVLRGYRDEHLRLEPSAAGCLQLLNLGPAHALLESITVNWVDGSEPKTLYRPVCQLLGPGDERDVLTIQSIPDLMKAIGTPAQTGRPIATRAFRLTLRLAMPGDLLEVPLLIKPLAVSATGSGYFGVVLDR